MLHTSRAYPARIGIQAGQGRKVWCIESARAAQQWLALIGHMIYIPAASVVLEMSHFVRHTQVSGYRVRTTKETTDA